MSALRATPAAGPEPSIRSVERALDLLDHLAARPDLTLTDISRELGIDKSTASRQLAFLERRNLVMRDPTNGRYALGYKLLELGTLVAERSPVLRVAHPYMVQLRDRVDETIGLYERAGSGRVCVAQVESHQDLRRTLPIGVVRGLYPGSPGKPFLAAMPDAQLEPIIAACAEQQFAAGGQPDPDRLREEIRQVREQGFAFSSQEQVPGGASLSVPLVDFRDAVVAVLAVSGPASRMRGEHLAHIIGEARAAGEAISRLLGRSPSKPEAGGDADVVPVRLPPSRTSADRRRS
ncbi:MAG: IclR family transcriptional regulator [Solirubrobacterales bacterium]